MFVGQGGSWLGMAHVQWSWLWDIWKEVSVGCMGTGCHANWELSIKSNGCRDACCNLRASSDPVTTFRLLEAVRSRQLDFLLWANKKELFLLWPCVSLLPLVSCTLLICKHDLSLPCSSLKRTEVLALGPRGCSGRNWWSWKVGDGISNWKAAPSGLLAPGAPSHTARGHPHPTKGPGTPRATANSIPWLSVGCWWVTTLHSHHDDVAEGWCYGIGPMGWCWSSTVWLSRGTLCCWWLCAPGPSSTSGDGERQERRMSSLEDGGGWVSCRITAEWQK